MPGLIDKPVSPTLGYGADREVNKGTFPEIADGNDSRFDKAKGKQSLENFPIPENGTINTTTWNGDGLAKNANNETT